MTAEAFAKLVEFITEYFEKLMAAFAKIEDYFFHGGIEEDLQA